MDPEQRLSLGGRIVVGVGLVSLLILSVLATWKMIDLSKDFWREMLSR